MSLRANVFGLITYNDSATTSLSCKMKVLSSVNLLLKCINPLINWSLKLDNSKTTIQCKLPFLQHAHHLCKSWSSTQRAGPSKVSREWMPHEPSFDKNMRNIHRPEASDLKRNILKNGSAESWRKELSTASENVAVKPRSQKHNNREKESFKRCPSAPTR